MELHGDRNCKDDKAMVGGLGMIDDLPVMFVGQQKGANTKLRQYRNFGMANPEGYRKIGERTQDILDYQPGHLRWQRTTIPEYVSTEDKQQAPVKEPSPLPPVPNTMISPALAATLIIDKHCDHLPHYRQSQRFFREQAA